MNKLTFIKVVGKNSHGSKIGEFSCECGGKTITLIQSVKSGRTRSCGCIRYKARNRVTHDMANTKFYGVYKTIKSRCNNKNVGNYYNYGGRGIKILWKDFEHFYDDMYESYKLHSKLYDTTSIDRIDNNGHYCKENCRWATMREQSSNTRKNLYFTINGETKCVAEWARTYNLTPQRVIARLGRDKWTIEESLGLIPKIRKPANQQSKS